MVWETSLGNISDMYRCFPPQPGSVLVIRTRPSYGARLKGPSPSLSVLLIRISAIIMSVPCSWPRLRTRQRSAWSLQRNVREKQPAKGSEHAIFLFCAHATRAAVPPRSDASAAFAWCDAAHEVSVQVRVCWRCFSWQTIASLLGVKHETKKKESAFCQHISNSLTASPLVIHACTHKNADYMSLFRLALLCQPLRWPGTHGSTADSLVFLFFWNLSQKVKRCSFDAFPRTDSDWSALGAANRSSDSQRVEPETRFPAIFDSRLAGGLKSNA